MKLTITHSNFSAENDWIFKLKDDEGNTFYILNSKYYRDAKLKSPITRNQLHYYYKGSVIEAEVKELNTLKVVTTVFEYALA